MRSRILLRAVIKGALLIGALVLLPRLITALFALPRIESVEDVQESEAAVVFGAGLRRDGSPTRVLQARVQAASDLYQAGKVSTLLMSGESPEPAAMGALAVQYGIPSEAILLDNGGLRTYDTCYRAKNVFGFQETILVTQKFHLPRALYICHGLGLAASGVPAQEAFYWPSTVLIWQLRETVATVVAFRDVHLTRPEPAFAGGQLPQEQTE